MLHLEEVANQFSFQNFLLALTAHTLVLMYQDTFGVHVKDQGLAWEDVMRDTGYRHSVLLNHFLACGKWKEGRELNVWLGQERDMAEHAAPNVKGAHD